MSISPREIMKGSVLNYDGRPQIVKGINEFICFESKPKEWVGGSMIEGEPLSDLWLERLGFAYRGDSFYWSWSDPLVQGRCIHIIKDPEKEAWYVKYELGTELITLHAIFFVHQLQVLFFGIVGEHLVVPKLK